MTIRAIRIYIPDRATYSDAGPAEVRAFREQLHARYGGMFAPLDIGGRSPFPALATDIALDGIPGTATLLDRALSGENVAEDIDVWHALEGQLMRFAEDRGFPDRQGALALAIGAILHYPVPRPRTLQLCGYAPVSDDDRQPASELPLDRIAPEIEESWRGVSASVFAISADDTVFVARVRGARIQLATA